jgi:hypothetical protein
MDKPGVVKVHVSRLIEASQEGGRSRLAGIEHYHHVRKASGETAPPAAR